MKPAYSILPVLFNDRSFAELLKHFNAILVRIWYSYSEREKPVATPFIVRNASLSIILTLTDGEERYPC